MKIAIPLKTNKNMPAISPLFGHAKWFAFIDGDEIQIERNFFDGGREVANWLLENGIDTVITQHIGYNPFMILKQNNVKCFYPGDGRIIFSEAVDALREGKLTEITEENIENFTRHAHTHH